MLETCAMRNRVLLGVAGRIRPIAAIFISLVLLVSVFSVQGNDDGMYTSRSQYLNSENQDDDQGCDGRGSCSVADTKISADIHRTQFPSDYVLEREVGLHVRSLSVSSHLNRAPPLL